MQTIVVKPPGSRRARPTGDGLLGALPRLPQMHMKVNQPRRDDFSRAVDFVHTVLPVRRPDPPVRDDQISNFIPLIGRVDNAPVAEKELFHSGRVPPFPTAAQR
jgi:hypothetical protein